jgi:hypothetical protein
MSYEPQLISLLDEMPSTFSGKQFCKKCIEYGIDPDIVKKGIPTSFLYIHANIIEGTRSWIKKDVKVYQPIERVDEIIFDTVPELTYEQECIQYLKEKGYKILKLNWEEQ